MFIHPFSRVCLVLGLAACSAAAAAPGGVDLARLQDWDIVLAGDAIESEKFAAEELQHHVSLATGHTLPIVTGSDRADRHIFVGPSDLLGRSWVGVLCG